MNTPNEALRTLAQAFRALPPDRHDRWRPLAESLERYADGNEEFADLLRVRRHRLDISEHVPNMADKLKVTDWLRTLKEPHHQSNPIPRESPAV